jgi:gamma-glutamyltranspeptidase/glutathione hydrolase
MVISRQLTGELRPAGAALAAFLFLPLTVAEAREAVTAKSFMVAAAHPLAVEAGYEVLKRGGSAVDAAIAVQLVLGLVEPESSGIGGGAFLLHWSEQERKLRSYDGRETAPATARPERFLDARKQPLPFEEAVIGGLSVGVPGVLRMLELAHQRHGRLAWNQLFDPAIKAAAEGFALSPKLHTVLQRERFLRDDPRARALYYDKPVGARIVNREYADTLRVIARGGAGQFYEGDIAKDIVLTVRTHAKPGDLTEADLAGYRALEREPVCGPYRQWRVCSMGPPSSGGIAVPQILGMLERVPFRRRRARPRRCITSEAGRLAYADRARATWSDPDFCSYPSRETCRRIICRKDRN